MPGKNPVTRHKPFALGRPRNPLAEVRQRRVSPPDAPESPRFCKTAFLARDNRTRLCAHACRRWICDAPGVVKRRSRVLPSRRRRGGTLKSGSHGLVVIPASLLTAGHKRIRACTQPANREPSRRFAYGLTRFACPNEKENLIQAGVGGAQRPATGIARALPLRGPSNGAAAFLPPSGACCKSCAASAYKERERSKRRKPLSRGGSTDRIWTSTDKFRTSSDKIC
jgi:hypothetical protein